MTLETDVISVYTTSHFAGVKLDWVNSSSIQSRAFYIYSALAVWTSGFGLWADEHLSMGHLTWFIWGSDQIKGMHNVFRAEGRIHKGDLAYCINQEMLVNGEFWKDVIKCDKNTMEGFRKLRFYRWQQLIAKVLHPCYIRISILGHTRTKTPWKIKNVPNQSIVRSMWCQLISRETTV